MEPSNPMSAVRRVARGRRRGSAGLTALAASIFLLALPAAAFASFTWSGATGVDRDGGTVISVSCSDSTQCTAVDLAGQEITYNPSNNNVIKTASIDGTEPLQAVSCSSASQCTAADGDGREVTFDPTSGHIDTQQTVDPDNSFYGLDCTSDTQCVGTVHNYYAVVFNPQDPSSPSRFKIDTSTLERLSCWNNGTEECTAVDDTGNEITFDPNHDTILETAAVDPGTKLYGVSCQGNGSVCTAVGTDGTNGKAVDFVPSTGTATPVPGPAAGGVWTYPLYSVSCTSGTCEVVDQQGKSYTVNPTAATTSGGTLVDYTGEIHQVFCTSGSQCTGVDNVGNEITFDPGSAGSGPIPIDPANGLRTVACASSSVCVGGDGEGQIVTFNPNTPNSSIYDGIDNLGFNGVSCPSASQCTAVDGNGYAFTFNPSSPGSPVGQAINAGDYLSSVACPSTNQCTAVDGYGAEYTFHPNGGAIGSLALANVNLTSVSCSSTSQCTAVDADGQEATFDPATSTQIGSTTTLDGNALTAVACPSAGQCTAVDNVGNQVTFIPANPAGAVPADIDGTNAIDNIACVSTALCVAVDAAGNAIEDDAGTWTVDKLSGEGALTSIACSSATQCVVADVTGMASVGAFNSPPPPLVPVSLAAPTITGGITVGDTLTEVHGTWSNGPTSYTYQWQRCNSNGAACVAIAGATGQTYTLSAADPGSSIRVAETASNGAGAGAQASSNATAVIAAVPVAVTTSLPAPPIAKLLKALISSKHHDAKFHFTASGVTTSYKCAIVRKPTRKGAKTPAPKYTACGTSKTYSKLKPGKYLFYVRAIGPGGSNVKLYHFKIS
jgi:hypothetical protein